MLTDRIIDLDKRKKEMEKGGIPEEFYMHVLLYDYAQIFVRILLHACFLLTR